MRKRNEPIKEEAINLKWTDIKFNGRYYKGMDIEVYDYKNNKNITVKVSSVELERELQKYFQSKDTTVPKDLIKRAEDLYNKYTVFIPKGAMDVNNSPKTLKKIVEDNLYPSYY